eukprot:CAMPEP_0113939628 /NCGR_PEP_ID=MMETSP1339-20121228/5916_1 /TAXON_ID=94617 /ORGANISM="Fibrocapsa japonica" /LENGTH=208 /DNA_ID=CAMNT_0000943199 /DNA_START=65 /DNA_END=691 /DNA_ORIENTATION=+ /assembly_acc=CAM_ASM_000762
MDCRHEHEETGGGDHSHDHSHEHSHDHNHSHEAEDPDGCSLYGSIDTTKVRCLNECPPGTGLNCLKPHSRRKEPEPVLQSNEDDPELIIHVPFSTAVKINSICVVGRGEGCAPSVVKMWVNREDIDFSNAQDVPATQQIDLVEENPQAEIDYPTMVRKFQNVSTIISYLGFKGEKTSFKHGVVEAVYESKPMPEDHEAPSEYKGQSIV